MIDSKSLKIEVGIKAYEKYIDKKINYKYIEVYPECNKYRFGVFVLHLPTGEVAYCNTERSQIKNRDKALIYLEEKIKSSSIL